MKKYLLFALTFVFVALAFSQDGFDDNVQDVPVDGGILTVLGSSSHLYILHRRNQIHS